MNKIINQEFELFKMDELQELAIEENVSTFDEVKDLVDNEIENLEYELEKIHDDFLQTIMYDVLQELNVSNISVTLCELLEIEMKFFYD